MSGKKGPFLDIDEVTGNAGELASETAVLEARPAPKRRIGPAVGIGAGQSRSQNIIDLMDNQKQEIETLKLQLESAKGEGREALKLTMPISGMEVVFNLQKIECALIEVSEENERDQSLLDQAALADILPSIQKDGQQHPGTVRPLKGGKFELIEGSRRLACCRFLGVSYLAWVGNVPDADVRALSRIENKHNHISLYEKARSYLKDIDRERYKNWEQLAAAEGFSSRTATRYRRMAELDKLFVKAFPNPTELSVTIADWLTQKIELHAAYKTKLLACAQELVSEREKRIACGEELLSASEISAFFKKAIRINSVKPTQKKPVTYSARGNPVRMKHSVSNKGTAKLEFIGVSEDKMEQVLSAVLKVLNIE